MRTIQVRKASEREAKENKIAWTAPWIGREGKMKRDRQTDRETDREREKRKSERPRPKPKRNRQMKLTMKKSLL